MTRLRLPLSSLVTLSLAGAALFAPGCGNADDGSPEQVGTVSQRAAAGVVISEIAYDPAGAEPDTEWVELYNPGDTPFTVVDPKIQEVGTPNPIAIAPANNATLVIPAKGYVVIARTTSAIAGAVAGTYGSVSLNNSGTTGPNGLSDTVKIFSGTTLLDQVDYGTTASKGWPTALEGTAIQLSVDKLEADNNLAANWCRATAPYVTGETAPKSGFGSPGLPNVACAGGAAGAAGSGGATAGAGGITGVAGAGGITGVAGVGGATGVGGTTGTGGVAGAGGIAGATGVGGASGGAGGASTGPVPPAPGDIVITEIMPDPSTAAVPDDKNGEWFEVLNISAKTLELSGIVLKSDSVSHTVSKSIVVAPGGYAVFANNADSATNGGLPAGTYAYPSNFVLSNTADDIVIELANGTLLDSVSYVNADIDSGKSRSLSVDKATVADNGTQTEPASAAWCHGTTTYGKGDIGTPGAANDPCGGGTGGAGGSAGGGAAGKAGAGGAAGKAGTGGAAGKAGTGGTAGKAGTGGTSGTAGKAGTGGSGEGGEAGTGGTGGTGGTAGKGGSGTAGKGGSAAAGKGGSAGSGAAGKGGTTSGKGGSTNGKGGSASGAAGSATLAPEEEADSGCGCRTAPANAPATPASFGLAALALAWFARRKRG